jgi:hypothetical protein
MKRREIEDGLVVLQHYLPDVLRVYRARRTRARCKAARARVLRTFLRTKSLKNTAHDCRLSPERVRQIVSNSIYAAKRIAGSWPPPVAD